MSIHISVKLRCNKVSIPVIHEAASPRKPITITFREQQRKFTLYRILSNQQQR